jgi:hypothetical protein
MVIAVLFAFVLWSYWNVMIAYEMPYVPNETQVALNAAQFNQTNVTFQSITTQYQTGMGNIMNTSSSSSAVNSVLDLPTLANNLLTAFGLSVWFGIQAIFLIWQTIVGIPFIIPNMIYSLLLVINDPVLFSIFNYIMNQALLAGFIFFIIIVGMLRLFKPDI